MNNDKFISRDILLALWFEAPRIVPVDVMVTSAEMEDSAKSPWGFYDPISERYEKLAHEKALAGKKPFCDYGSKREDWTSYGIFQMMGFTLRENDYFGITSVHEQVKAGNFSPFIYVSLCMSAYDKHMGKLIKRYGLPRAFKRYNGGGKAAEAYMQKAIGYWERVKKELTEQGII